MIRIVGILCGSALAVAFLIVALGVPDVLPNKNEEVQPEPVVATTIAIEPEPIEPRPAAIEPEPVAIEPEPVAAANTPEPPIVIENWYAFWTPFRSELAANGFIAQLQRTTGLDYRVMKQEPGVYAVAFAYANDSDIQGKLSAISTATGLELPGG